MSTNDVRIFDTTLRDGEQSPGFSMTQRQKLRMAQMLAALKVDIIEAGFAAASDGDFNCISTIAREIEGPTICSLARCNPGDIEASARALEPAAKKRLHVFIATSPIHREYKLKLDREQVLAQAIGGVKMALELTDDVEFSAEDAIRTEPEYLVEVIEAVIAAGATTVNIPDTVGYTTPGEMAQLITHLRQQVPNIDQAVISTHCHNDLGMAVANSLAAVEAGAGQIECTINGIGERAGNASLEEIVMALKTRSDHYGRQTNIDTRKLHPASRLLAGITGTFVARNKAIVGDNAFAHEAGIHQHGILEHAETYEIMKPEDVGVNKSDLVLGKHSGRHAVSDRIAALGFDTENVDMTRVFKDFKTLADRKKTIYDADLEALVTGQAARSGPWQLSDLKVVSGSGDQLATASVSLTHESGEVHTQDSDGDGPLDAAFKAMIRATGLALRVSGLAVRSVTQGEDAQGEAEVRAQWGTTELKGTGVSTDIIAASTQALLEIINAASRQVNRDTTPNADAPARNSV
ncbi:MAG: 2-isopropylmalate synthase [Lysobacterales bacterium]